MLATIVLSPGTTRIHLREVPGLFANALHPELPDATPRVLSFLQKEALTRELAWQWCGMNNDFPVSLTEADVQELNATVWRDLAPLALLPDTDEGPQRLATHLTEPDWEPYARAFAASPPEGWRLIAVWRNIVLDNWFKNHEARKQWKRLLEQQATSGQLTPRAAVSGIPTQHTAGRQLMEAFFTVPEFTEFARQFDVAVTVQKLFTRKPMVAELLRELRKVAPDEGIRVSEAMGGRKGDSWMPAREFVQHFTEVMRRQAAGYFTVDEAAQLLSDAHGIDVQDLMKRMAVAKVHGRRLIRTAQKLPLMDKVVVTPWVDLVSVEDVNTWLAMEGVPYRLPLGESDEFISLETTLAPYFAFSLGQLPDHIAARVRAEYAAPMTTWDEATPAQRRDLAQQKDSQADPALEPMRKWFHAQAKREQKLLDEIAEVKATPVTNLSERVLQKQLLSDLDAQLERLRAERWSATPPPPAASASPEPLPPAESPAPVPPAGKVPMTRAALVAAHGSAWPSIEADLTDASKNGLSDAAKVGKRGWDEDRALEWARAKNKMTPQDSAPGNLADAMRSMSSLPSRKHRLGH